MEGNTSTIDRVVVLLSIAGVGDWGETLLLFGLVIALHFVWIITNNKIGVSN